MNFEPARLNMVETQLFRRGITDKRVLTAMKKVPREQFVPERMRDEAYADCPLSIGEGQTISQPYMVGIMTETLGLQGNEKVLEIGTGSGYQTAILAELAKEVISIERISALAKLAQQRLGALGYNNIKTICANGTFGYPTEQPYDAILVTAGAPEIPSSLVDQLRLDGKMVIPVGSKYSQMLTVVEKQRKGYTSRPVCGCVFVPLVGKQGWAHEDQ